MCYNSFLYDHQKMKYSLIALIFSSFVIIHHVAAVVQVHCSFISLSPTLGPYYGKTNVTINFECDSPDESLVIDAFQDSKVKFGSHVKLLSTIQSTGYVLTKLTGSLQLSEQVLWKYSASCVAPPLETFTYTGNGSVVLVEIAPFSVKADLLLAEGALPYQYYKFLDYGAKLSEDFYPIRSSGGQTLCVGLSHFTFLQDNTLGTVRLTQEIASNFSVEYPLQKSDILQNSTFYLLCATLDDELMEFSSSKPLNLSIALNGQDFEFHSTIPLIDTQPKKLIIFYQESATGIQFSSWDFQHNLGVQEANSQFSTSLETILDSNVDLYSAKSAEDFRPYLENKGYHSAYITSTIRDYERVLPDLVASFPDIKFAYCQDPENKTLVVSDESGVVLYWSHLYQARYLNGYIAGLMLAATGGKKICYIKAYDEPENNLALNAFAQGVLKSSPSARIHFWVAGTYDRSFVLQQLSAHLEANEDCDQLSMFTYNQGSLQIFTRKNKYVTTSNFDARQTIGDYVLSSATIDWSKIYDLLMRFLLNEKHIPGEFVGLGWNSEAVLVSDLSSNVSPKLLKQFKNEVEILNSKGAEYVILCGPLNDTEGVTHYVESNGQGYCPTIQELYGIDWSLSNTVDEGRYTVIPPDHHDNKIPDSMKYATFAALAIFYTLFIGVGIWIKANELHPAIKFAQPSFLYAVLFGCTIGVTSVIFFGIDRHISDEEAYKEQTEGLESLNDHLGNAACQSAIWLMVIGFGLTFPVLCAKTWRLHRIVLFLNQSLTLNLKTLKNNIGVEYFVVGYLLLLCIPLITWQTLTPLLYVVRVTSNDEYGNPIESFGSCTQHELASPIVVVVIIFISCVVGNYVCFLARNDESINNEITYISLGLMNYFQIFVIGVPLVLMTEEPIFRYMLSVGGVFIAFVGLAALIFLPKIVAVQFPATDGNTFAISSRKTVAEPSANKDKQPVEQKLEMRDSSYASSYDSSATAQNPIRGN